MIEIKAFYDGQEVGTFDFSDDTVTDLVDCIRRKRSESPGAAYLSPITIAEVLAYAQAQWLASGMSLRNDRVRLANDFVRGGVTADMTPEQLAAHHTAKKRALGEYLGMAEVGTKPQ